jgi:hypothetical protein
MQKKLRSFFPPITRTATASPGRIADHTSHSCDANDGVMPEIGPEYNPEPLPASQSANAVVSACRRTLACTRTTDAVPTKTGPMYNNPLITHLKPNDAFTEAVIYLQGTATDRYRLGRWKNHVENLTLNSL